jgi:NitT/TauT family transport system substrate-binding protein
MNLFALLFTVFYACSSSTTAETISLQLNWMPEAEHGGYYQALAEGYYKEEGIELEIRAGGSGVRVETETALQRAHFGITNADKLLAVREKGLELTALLAPFQHSPRVLIYHQEQPISSFQELQKAELLILNNTKPFYRFLLSKHPLLKEVDTIPYNKALFIENKSSVIQGYINAEPLIFEKKGIKVGLLKLSELGFNPYASLLICSEQLLKEQPKLVAKMRRASIKGWTSYLNDPSKGNAAIAKLNPSIADHLADSAELLPKLMEASPFGAMSEERWSTLAAQLQEAGVLSSSPRQENLYQSP